MNLGTFLQDLAQKIPGNNFAQTRLGDVLTGGLGRAINRNDWRLPGYGSDQTSVDDLAAVGTGNSSRYRGLARGVGTLFGLWGLGTAAGGGGGASEVGSGFPLAEEAGGSGAGGQLSGPEASTPWTDYLRRYGRQGMNLVSRMGGSGLGGMMGGAPMPPIDNSMILPIPTQQPQSELPPGLLTMLLANAMQQQLRQQQPEHDQPGPTISGGMV